MNKLIGLSNIFPVIIVLILASLSHAQGSIDTVTISEAPGFETLRCRGQLCLTELPYNVDCESPFQNGCLCASYVRDDATKALSSCAFATDYINCATPLKEVEYTAVVSIYNHYCSLSAAAVTITEDSSEPSMTGDLKTKPAPVASTVVVTITSSSNGGTPVTVAPSSQSDTSVTAVSLDTDVPYASSSLSWSGTASVSSTTIQNPDASSTDKIDGGHDGLPQTDKIALGVGLSVPVASLILGLVVYFRPRYAHRNAGMDHWEMNHVPSHVTNDDGSSSRLSQ
ncbi:MAG: hypothetical protein LQ342_004168 [Letrouitia transgressa]|nr:MAG: hypothetical protein LQ342_004168 [Letrouitia transgressa]